MAGRVSEETFLGKITTGAGNDFERATSIARQMVCDWGMSELGPIQFGQRDDLIFLGRDMMSHPDYSEETARKIDQEIKRIIDNAYQRTKKNILGNREKLVKIAQSLLERESLSSDDINTILEGGELQPLNNNVKEKKETAKDAKDTKNADVETEGQSQRV